MKSYHLITKHALLLLGTLAFLSSFVYADELKLLKEKSFSTKDYENIYVDAAGADVKIESWNKAEILVKIFGNSKAESKLKYDIQQSENTVKIIIKKRSSLFSWFNGNINVKVQAFVPAKYNAHVETSGGDISVNDLTGAFNFSTSGGDIALTKLNGKVTAETSGGDIHLIDQNGNANLATSGGDIVCQKVYGDIKAETSGGDIKIEQKDGALRAETSGGDINISYSGVNKGIYAATSGGDITATLPADFKAKVYLETSGGDVDSNFKNASTNKVKRSMLEADYNGGGPTLKLETTGGDIVVNQK